MKIKVRGIRSIFIDLDHKINKVNVDFWKRDNYNQDRVYITYFFLLSKIACDVSQVIIGVNSTNNIPIAIIILEINSGM